MVLYIPYYKQINPLLSSIKSNSIPFIFVLTPVFLFSSLLSQFYHFYLPYQHFSLLEDTHLKYFAGDIMNVKSHLSFNSTITPVSCSVVVVFFCGLKFIYSYQLKYNILKHLCLLHSLIKKIYMKLKLEYFSILCKAYFIYHSHKYFCK